MTYSAVEALDDPDLGDHDLPLPSHPIATIPSLYEEDLVSHEVRVVLLACPRPSPCKETPDHHCDPDGSLPLNPTPLGSLGTQEAV